MSRSYRKNPVLTGNSNKQWRSDSNRRFRRVNKIRVKQREEPLLLREVCNIYNSPKDGYFAFYDYNLNNPDTVSLELWWTEPYKLYGK